VHNLQLTHTHMCFLILNFGDLGLKKVWGCGLVAWLSPPAASDHHHYEGSECPCGSLNNYSLVNSGDPMKFSCLYYHRRLTKPASKREIKLISSCFDFYPKEKPKLQCSLQRGGPESRVCRLVFLLIPAPAKTSPVV
jgi:hypothetical protein